MGSGPNGCVRGGQVNIADFVYDQVYKGAIAAGAAESPARSNADQAKERYNKSMMVAKGKASPTGAMIKEFIVKAKNDSKGMK